MLQILRDLLAHNGHANALLLAAIDQNGAAASDPELDALLHHILIANRFWVSAVVGTPFVFEEESRRSTSFAELVERYRTTHHVQSQWMTEASEPDLARELVQQRIPGGKCSVAHAFLQVCLHSHGHRAQCAKLLRRHGTTPPVTDFILWAAERPAPDWPLTALPAG